MKYEFVNTPNYSWLLFRSVPLSVCPPVWQYVTLMIKAGNGLFFFSVMLISKSFLLKINQCFCACYHTEIYRTWFPTSFIFNIISPGASWQWPRTIHARTANANLRADEETHSWWSVSLMGWQTHGKHSAS